jgi:hypothetical protein
MAGAIEFSHHWSANVYSMTDTAFLRYRYNITDTWLGYNMGLHNPLGNRRRHFMAVRFFDGYFLEQPDLVEHRDTQGYSNAYGYLAAYSFYRTDFFRTRYIYGFGRTEDVPNGVSVSAIGGYVRQQQIERPYWGANIQHFLARPSGSFYQVTVEGGAYSRQRKAEDVVFSVAASYTTPAFSLKEFKIRTFLSAGWVGLFNPVVIDPVEIRDSEVYGFSADSVWGNRKFYFRLESVVFTPWQVLGVRMAPFVGMQHAWLRCNSCTRERLPIWGISGGLRMRNENLIFGTVEIRVTYVPTTVETASKISLEFRQRLQVKNTAGFVRSPALIRY